MAKSMTGMSVKRAATAAATDKNPVYKTVVRELRTLQTAVESPSGSWTLLKERSSANGSIIEKRK
ncbi:hypothetical protein [Mesorhizobium sp. 113-3-9]|uniref:hypothetical protein n=1 Tax=Mesorhizobium sp. 113-3-9 TaxID=2744517 RepID=UPI001928521D|nr:hypothetical protein [Mesorhizobium sp. 113-3-9]